MKYENLYKLQQLAAKRIQKADFEEGKEILDLLYGFIMESNGTSDEWCELYIDCRDYYYYAKKRVELGCEYGSLLSLEEFMYLQEDEFFSCLIENYKNYYNLKEE